MKYTAKYIQIKVGTEQRELVYEDENGNQIVGSDEECGLLLRKGEQLFDANGKEIELPEGIKKIDEYIGRDNEERYELFYATREDGKKTILEYEFKSRSKECEPSKKLRFLHGCSNAEIVPIELKDTFFEAWVKYPKFSEKKTKLEDWVLVKYDSYIKGFNYLYTFFNLKSRATLDHFEYDTTDKMLADMSCGRVWYKGPVDFLIAIPLFIISDKGDKCMLMGNYVTSEVLFKYGWYSIFMTRE